MSCSRLQSRWGFIASNVTTRPRVPCSCSPSLQSRLCRTALPLGRDISTSHGSQPGSHTFRNSRTWRLTASILSASAALGAIYLHFQQHGGVLHLSKGAGAPPKGSSADPEEQKVATQSAGIFISEAAGRPGHARLKAQDEIYERLVDNPPEVADLPLEEAILTTAPNVPPPVTRDYSVRLHVPLETNTKKSQLTSQYKYEKWTFNGTVPGPFIRARVGDVVELEITNRDETGNPHNIDCHAFTGPGGGAALTTVEENETKTARFRLLTPGLYVYHCSAAPVPVHIANGMYGMMYVQPLEGDLPPVDREYYVMQSEFYHEPPEIEDDGRPSKEVEFSYPNALLEEPSVVVFNGSDSALTRDNPLKACVDERVRIFFGNAGPNLTSSFHVIGSNFHRVYREGGVLNAPGRYISTVSVPPGATTIVDLKMLVPGTYTLLDHAMFRLDRGAVGFLNVSGRKRPDIYSSDEPPAPCTGCKLHA